MAAYRGAQMKPDWLSRILLLAILAVVCYLALRPQAGRYRIEDLPYVFDTATGRLVMLSADEAVKTHWQKLNAEEKVKEEQTKREELTRLARECPAILAEGARPKNEGRSFEKVLDDASHAADLRKCQEWRASFP